MASWMPMGQGISMEVELGDDKYSAKQASRSPKENHLQTGKCLVTTTPFSSKILLQTPKAVYMSVT
jgi:hypothetical protein